MIVMGVKINYEYLSTIKYLLAALIEAIFKRLIVLENLIDLWMNSSYELIRKYLIKNIYIK